MDSASYGQSPPNSATSTGTKRTRLFLPLSHHGMPRTPLPTSPDGSVRSHRFDRDQKSPRSPGSPGSPPMSARTFTTFYGSEPSYSPRAPSHISNGSTLIASPVPTPSIPPVPKFGDLPVPKFDNIETVHKHRRNRSSPSSPIDAPEPNQPSSRMIPLPPDSIERAIGEPEAPDVAPQEEQNVAPGQPSPLSRLASRMRSIFGSKAKDPDRKAEAKRRSKEAREELDKMEDVHWTEM